MSNKIHISGYTAGKLRSKGYAVVQRGFVTVKVPVLGLLYLLCII